MLLSAVAFGAMGPLGKLAYDEGATVGTLLAVRFALAAVVAWALLLATPTGSAEVRSVTGHDVALGLALGAFGYAAQAGGYFAALQRIDASLLSLLVYTYPVIVAVAATRLGRDRLDARRLVALTVATGGLALVVAGAGTGKLDAIGTTLGVVTAVVYSGYILASERVAGRVAPRALSALVCTGAGATLTAVALVAGQLRPEAVTTVGWVWLVSLAVVSTVVAMALFFAGLHRVGPANAAIVSTAEPVVTVVLAMIVFGEILTPMQVLGGMLVLAGVLVLHLRVERLSHAPA